MRGVTAPAATARPPEAPAASSLARRLHLVEPALLLGACVIFVGVDALSPTGQAAVGHATRDLFDHLALLDHWSLRAPEQAFPDGGALFPPDLTGMVLAAPALALGLPRALAWNLMVLGQLWLACLAAWALGRRYGAGLVAGVGFGLSPYLLGQALSGEAETLAAWPLPLMALLLERGADHWRAPDQATGSAPRLLVLAGLAAAMGALGAWYYGAFISAYLLVWLLLRGWGVRGFDRRSLIAPLSFAVAIAGPALAYARVLAASDQLFRGPSMSTYLAHYPRSLAGMVADPAAFFGPGTPGSGHADNLGVVLVGLAIMGTLRGARGRERAAWWWAVAVGALVLALGPVLYVRGSPVWDWMPYRLLAELPLLGLMRLPHRWLLVVFLGLSVLAARGARGFSWLAAFLVLGEAMGFSVVDRPRTDIAPPAILAEVDGPVLDLPPRTIGDDARGHYLVWQRLHRQPIAYTLLMQSIGPQVAAEPLVQAVAGLDQADPIASKVVEAEQFRQREFALAAAEWRAGRGDRDTLQGAADRLRGLGYTEVILHLHLLADTDAARIAELLEQALGAPSVQTEEALLWRL